MVGVPWRKATKTCMALVMVAVLAVCFALPAFAVTPERPENQYVLDEAGVLSEETEQEIISKNADLFQETGAQIVVVAVDFLDGEEIDDYANYLFNYWGIGSVERNNGLLLLMAIAEDNYYATSGYGIEDYFDGAKLQEMLNEYLEPDFAARDYDAGAKKFFEAALSEMESYYANYSDQYTSNEGQVVPDYDYYEDYQPSIGQQFRNFFEGFFGVFVRVIFVVIFVVVISAVIRGMGGGRGGPRSGGGGGGGSGFLTGLLLGNMLSGSRRRSGWRPPPPGGFGPRPPRGGGGFGGFGGFHGGGSGGGFGGFRGGGGGFHGGGGSRGGGAGRR